MWRKHKTQLNRSRLRKQIAWCNRLANKDKCSYYTNHITANSDDPKKLWQSLRKTLHRTSETILPAHSSEKSLKDCLDILLPSITKFVDYSLIDGPFPSAFKRAVVTPAIKKASLPRNDLKNYCPVSGLCFLSKLVERIVANLSCKACFLQMCDLHRIRQYLTPEVAVLVANALVSSRLDYCNSLFRGLSCFNQHKLQSIQNTLARIVTNHKSMLMLHPL